MPREIRFNVAGDHKDDVPILQPDRPTGIAAILCAFEGPNRLVAVIPNESTGGATLTYQHGQKSFRVILPPVGEQFQNEAGEPPQLPPEYNGDPDRVALHYSWTVVMPALERRGQFYYREGQPFTIIESSAFRLYEHLLAGRDVTPFLQDCQDLGFNTLRVWLLNTSVGHIVPSEHSDFYQRLPDLLSLCGRYGQYVEFTVFTQTQTLMPGLSEQQAHYDQTVTAIGSRFCFVEGVNEADSHDNAYHPGLRLWKPAGATFDLCSGSNGSDAWVVEPVLESARYHSNDADQWWRRAAHNAMEMADRFNVPAWPNENTRPDHDPNPNHHFDAAAGSALLQAGYCHHDTSGKDCTVRTGLDWTCASAVVAGMRSIDLSQRVFPYSRHDEMNVPGQIIRVYQRGSQFVRIRA